MDKVAAEVREIASTANDAERRKLLDDLRELQYSLESPHDTLNRIIYYVTITMPEPFPSTLR